MYSTSSIIPFDSGRSFVVRTLPLEPVKYRIEDKMGRTEKDKIFLEQFETIFFAAAEGNLATCEKVVAKGFRDFNAYSVGRYGTQTNRLDHVSPLQIAEQHGHNHIVTFFKKIMNESPLNCSPKTTFKSDPYFEQLNCGMMNLLGALNMQKEQKKFESDLANIKGSQEEADSQQLEKPSESS
jgi:hypothetical protein